MIVVDATNTILGRFATKLAKSALEGETIFVVNSEKAYIVGDPRDIFRKYKALDDMGSKPVKGPFIPKQPHMMMKRTIKGMLPHNERGRRALKRVKCYIGVPEELKDKEAILIKEASIENIKTPKKIQIEQLCLKLGWQKPK